MKKTKKQLHIEKKPDQKMFFPNQESALIWEGMDIGLMLVTIEPKKTIDRNIYHHGKYFAMMTCAFNNQSKFTHVDHLREAVTIEAGYYEPLYTMKGIFKKARSIAFEKMNQDQFSVLYNLSVDILMSTYNWDDEMYLRLMSFM